MQRTRFTSRTIIYTDRAGFRAGVRELRQVCRDLRQALAAVPDRTRRQALRQQYLPQEAHLRRQADLWGTVAGDRLLYTTSSDWSGEKLSERRSKSGTRSLPSTGRGHR